ncbi:Mth938-like domain-containing protein [Aquicoccus sp. G2-2]|uniref:Mth938-like domain-containing protein n=1 Tax=Aquicoccus sp. G2-2 TaxID=3092120 RepID=UPI002AE0693F|nr:Mth938-like domain-containing protein [Aquicoccus sp. G2-2]MEA1112724.1 Mth938-like domain-containing protein [Aquicoccus sp. G2-2]
MQMHEMDMGGARPVEGYGPGFFRIGGEVFKGAVLVTLDGAQAWDGWDDSAALVALAGEIDVIFFGMGEEIAHLPKGLRAKVEAAGMGAEVMSSPAACRTWNLLAAEGRRVALAALPV